MSYCDDVLKIVGLVEEIADDESKLGQNIFKMLLISRSIMYSVYYNNEFCGDDIVSIVKRIDTTIKIGSLYNSTSYSSRSSSTQKKVMNKIIDCIMLMYAESAKRSVFSGEDLSSELNLMLLLTHMICHKLVPDFFLTSKKTPKKTDEQRKKEADSMIDAVDFYCKLRDCENIIEKEVVKLKTKGLVKSSKILAETHESLKKTDSVANISIIIDDTAKSLKKTGEKYTGIKILNLLRDLISFISRKLFVRRLKSSCKFFPRSSKKIKQNQTKEIRKDYC